MWHHKYVDKNIESKEILEVYKKKKKILETLSSCEHVKEKEKRTTPNFFSF
jgi:flagellar biosynthesis/type III secretory pathway chaperone